MRNISVAVNYVTRSIGRFSRSCYDRWIRCQVTTIVHGTTVATNALLERRGAKTGVITTKGFRDVLEMRRRTGLQRRACGEHSTHRSKGSPTKLKSEHADGTIDIELDVIGVRKAARYLLQQNCSALSIVFINSYVNSENEEKAKKAVEEIWPNSCHSVDEILPWKLENMNGLRPQL